MTLTTRYPGDVVARWTLKRRKEGPGVPRERVIATVRVHQRTGQPVYIPRIEALIRPHAVGPN